MNLLRTTLFKLRSLWQQREMKREIGEQLSFHLQQRTAENIAAGMAAEEAERQARKRFGNPVTFIAVVFLFTAVALLACFIPARRATRIDPMTALRCE